jgi:hypothetical protein
MLFHRCFVKRIGIALFNMDGILRAFAQACAQTVAEVIGRQHRLAVDHLDSALCARGDAESATVTFVLIDRYNFSQHG